MILCVFLLFCSDLASGVKELAKKVDKSCILSIVIRRDFIIEDAMREARKKKFDPFKAVKVAVVAGVFFLEQVVWYSECCPMTDVSDIDHIVQMSKILIKKNDDVIIGYCISLACKEDSCTFYYFFY